MAAILEGKEGEDSLNFRRSDLQRGVGPREEHPALKWPFFYCKISNDMKKYHIITFGCQMNKSDSERISADLENKGHKPATEMDEADLVVVNMCSVRQSAVDRVLGLTKKFAELKIFPFLMAAIISVRTASSPIPEGPWSAAGTKIS